MARLYFDDATWYLTSCIRAELIAKGIIQVEDASVDAMACGDDEEREWMGERGQVKDLDCRTREEIANALPGRVRRGVVSDLPPGYQVLLTADHAYCWDRQNLVKLNVSPQGDYRQN